MKGSEEIYIYMRLELHSIWYLTELPANITTKQVNTISQPSILNFKVV